MPEKSIGMMQGAFFVPKSQILAWINGLLKLYLSRIQQLGTGAAYCQVFDMMFPGKIKLSRVNWRARNQWEFINNLKILQAGFQKCGIRKHIQIELLARARYQDNLQFAQWFKRFYDKNYQGRNSNNQYDPADKRNSQVDFSFIDKRDPVKGKKQRYNMQRSLSPSRQLNKKNRNFSMKKPSMLEHDFQSIEKLLCGNLSQRKKLIEIQNIVKKAKLKAQIVNTQISIAQEQIQS